MIRNPLLHGSDPPIRPGQPHVAVALLAVGCSQPSPAQSTPVTKPVPTTAQPLTMTAPLPCDLRLHPRADAGQLRGECGRRSHRGPINPENTVTFRGGKGINVLSSLDVVVTCSDGTVLKESTVRSGWKHPPGYFGPPGPTGYGSSLSW